MNTQTQTIRRWLWFFMAALFLSGLTAIPVKQGAAFLYRIIDADSFLFPWIEQLHNGIMVTAKQYPFLFYGYDWLAFAHFVLALLFIGPLKDPVRNRWVIEFGIIACLLVIPFALIAGYLRGIPFWWRLVDCSFGLLGLIPLLICMDKINKLEKERAAEEMQVPENIFSAL